MRRQIKSEIYPALEALKGGEGRCNVPPETRMQTDMLSGLNPIATIQSGSKIRESEDEPDDLLYGN